MLRIYCVLSIALSTLFAANCSTVHRKSSELKIDNIQSLTDIVYSKIGQRELFLDLFSPSENGIYPGVILVHGGGWTSGSKLHNRDFAVALSKKGYVVANIEYRLAQEAQFPGAVEDVKTAIRWLRTNSRDYKVNTNRIFGIGTSAGGHLIAMAATTDHSNKFVGQNSYPNASNKLNATIIMGTGVDQVARVKAAPNQYVESAFIFFGGNYSSVSEKYVLGSPITHISEKMSPILMIDGELDMPGERYVNFRQRLDEVNIENEFVIVPEAGHGDWNNSLYLEMFIERCHAFLTKQSRENLSSGGVRQKLTGLW